MTEPDYITVAGTADPHKFLVMIMKYHQRDDQYIAGRVSQALSEVAARALARGWAATLKLEIR